MSSFYGDANLVNGKLYLEAFQLLSRTWNNGTAIPLDESEMGWEDTVAMYNGQVTKIMVKYDRFAGQFVWHCHLLEHEDHEMMRQFRVIPEPASWALLMAATLVLGYGHRTRA